MIECTSCHTLNPDSEAACLMCGIPLPSALPSAGGVALRCPAGHPIDPSWRSCPYCDRQQAAGGAAGRATRLESTAAHSAGPAGPLAEAPHPTRLDELSRRRLTGTLEEDEGNPVRGSLLVPLQCREDRVGVDRGVE